MIPIPPRRIHRPDKGENGVDNPRSVEYTSPMRLIVNAISAHTGGIVTYTTNVIHYLSKFGEQGTIFLPEWFSARPGRKEASTIKLRSMRATHYGALRRFLWEQLIWRRLVKQSGAEILFSSANYGLLRPPIRQVLLVQGETSFDPLYQRHILPRLSLAERRAFALRRRLVLWSARNSDLVIFPSRTSLESVSRYDPSIAAKSTVNHLGADDDLFDVAAARRWREDGTLRIIYLSIYYPHKDPHTLARATELLNRKGVAAHAWITMEPEDFAIWSTGHEDMGLLREDQRTGYLTLGRLAHTEVGTALANHDVLVFPSLTETFGFPLVEAMAVGVPVVAADTPIHREICGDAALYFEPKNPEDVCARLLELDAEADLRARCRERGKARVKERFTWERHMRALIDCFKAVTES